MPSSVDDRRRTAYEDATSLSQAMLDETFRGGENQIEFIGTLTKTVDGTPYTWRFADRPKFVGDNFYEGRARFPKVKRTIGELQAPSIQFSQIEIELANMDGFYNEYLAGGASYFPLIGAQVTLQVGLRDESGSFLTVFDGFVPEEDGFAIGLESITIRATDRFNSLNRANPLPVINDTDFPSAPDDSLGKIIPMVIGDWEAGYNYTANAGKVTASDGATPTPNSAEVLVDAPNSFYGGTIGYYVGGGYFVFSIGSAGGTSITPDTIAKVHIKRGDTMFQCDFNATPQNPGGVGYWCALVNGLINAADGTTFPYVYQNGDLAIIAVKVPYAVGKYSNPIEIAELILTGLGGASALDFDTSSWTALKTKATPVQSDMTSIKARVWIGEEKDSVLGVALGLLEQVRVEAFVNLAGDIALVALHPEDWETPSSFTRLDQVELDEDKTKVTADERTFFNQASLNYAFTPVTKKTERGTKQRKNQTSIDRSGKTVAKVIDVPWLYEETDAVNQLDEFLRFYSMGIHYVDVEAAWVHLRRDLGEFVQLNYEVGGLEYDAAPTIIRDVSVIPETGAVQLRLLSLANFPYAEYVPANAARFLSSASQSITDV